MQLKHRGAGWREGQHEDGRRRKEVGRGRSPFQSQRFPGGGTEGRQSWLEEAFNAHLEISRDFNSWLQGIQPALTQTQILTYHFR